VKVVLLLSALLAAFAQSIAFDVVSIKPASGRGVPPLIIAESMCSFRAGRLNCPGVTLRGLARLAFQDGGTPIPLSQIVGGPDWVATAQFALIATIADQDATEVRTQMPALIRALLEDRFKLKAHLESRPFPAYALVRLRQDGKPGPQLRPSATDCPAPPTGSERPSGLPPSPGKSCFGGIFRAGEVVSGHINMDGLAKNLTLFGGPDRIVVDRTQLDGWFDVELRWLPETSAPGATGGAGAADAPILTDKPPLVTALREQLGLKLEPRTERLPAIVIDYVERPDPN